MINASTENLTIFPEIFINQRWSIAEPLLAGDGRHGTDMTIDELQWSLTEVGQYLSKISEKLALFQQIFEL